MAKVSVSKAAAQTKRALRSPKLKAAAKVIKGSNQRSGTQRRAKTGNKTTDRQGRRSGETRHKTPAERAKTAAAKTKHAAYMKKEAAKSKDSVGRVKAKSVKSDLKKLMAHAKKGAPKPVKAKLTRKGIPAELEKKIKTSTAKAKAKGVKTPTPKAPKGRFKLPKTSKSSRMAKLRAHLKSITSGKNRHMMKQGNK